MYDFLIDIVPREDTKQGPLALHQAANSTGQSQNYFPFSQQYLSQMMNAQTRNMPLQTPQTTNTTIENNNNSQSIDTQLEQLYSQDPSSLHEANSPNNPRT